jgi:type I restriction enzyme M protein
VDAARYSLVLSTVPFSGSRDRASALIPQVQTKKAELVSAALSLQLLADGGQAAVIVPASLLIGASKAHKALRRMLVEDARLDAVIRLPRGAFKPQSSASSAILVFGKAAAGTDRVWFYDVRADGYSLDSRRVPLLPPEELGAWGVPSQDAAGGESPAGPRRSKNDLPDVLARWTAVRSRRDDASGEGDGAEQPRTAQCFFVPKAEIVAHDYDLSFDRYKQVERAETAIRAPEEILAELTALDAEIAHATRALAEVLKVDSSR